VAAEEVEASEFHSVENAGCFVRDLRNFIHDGLGSIERGGVGQLRESNGIAAILCRQKTVRHHFESETGQHEQTDVNEQHDGSEPGKPSDRSAVGIRTPGEDSVEAFEEPAEQAIEQALERILLRATWPK